MGAARPTRFPHRSDRQAVSLALGICALVASLGLGSPGRTALAAAGAPIVFLGDSITAGEGVPAEAAFPARLGAALGVPIVNAGRSGDTAARAIGRLTRDARRVQPRLVVVELGVNDVLDEHRPPDQVLRHLRTIVRRLRRDGVPVVLVHVARGDFGAPVYREGFRAIAREEGATLVEDFYAGLSTELLPDGLHPTAAGHARLAERLEPVLRTLLTPPAAPVR